MSKYILDFQSFKNVNNELVIKEMAILHIDQEHPKVFLFKEPFEWDSLAIRYKVENKWLQNHYHHLKWSSGEESYENVIKIIKDTLFDAKIIYVHGREKRTWLKRFVSVEIINLQDFDCPLLKIIKNSIRNKCSNHCNFNNNNMNCAINNVIVLRMWMSLIMK